MNEDKKMMLENIVKVYEMHSEAMLALIPVFEKFDGKVIDKRLDTAMTDALPEGQHAKWITEFGNLKIHIWNQANFKCGKYYDYPRNREIDYRMGRYEHVFDTTPSGKWRIKSAPIIAKLKEASAFYSERAEATNKVLLNADRIVEGIQERVTELKRYQDQFDYSALETLGAYVLLSGYSF